MTVCPGILSSGLGGSTTSGNGAGWALSQCKLGLADFYNFLNDPRLILWVVSQDTFLAHPKIISFPLGASVPLEVHGDVATLSRQ